MEVQLFELRSIEKLIDDVFAVEWVYTCREKWPSQQN